MRGGEGEELGWGGSDGHLQSFPNGPVLQELKWFSRGCAIRPTASLNDRAPLLIDLDGQHVMNLFRLPKAE